MRTEAWPDFTRPNQGVVRVNTMTKRGKRMPCRMMVQAATLSVFVAVSLAIPGSGARSASNVVQLMSYTGSLGDWSPYVADDLGYFKEEGVDFQMHLFQNPADATTAIISGRGDVATGSLPVVIAGAVAGAPIKLISATQSATPGSGYNNWWATLPDSPLNGPADLRGKKVDILAPNTLAQVATREILANAGLQVGEYQEVALPFPQSYTALEGGLTDVSLFIEPFYTRANERSLSKYGKPLKVVYTFLTTFKEGLNLSGMFANTNFLASNPDTARAFLRATTRAAKWGNAHPVELKQIIAKYAGVPYDDIKNMIPSQMSEDGRFIPGMLDRLQVLMIKYKMVPNFTTPLPDDRILDLSYLPSQK
jgi:ABC-type nitrate/sulfonate/bicarbonate transport system substrate-binding protein